MDRIALHGIEVWATHGVLPHEEQLGQRFVLDVVVHLDLQRAAASDELADTVDYGGIATVAARAAESPRAQLLESVAGRVVDAVLAADDRIGRVEVTLHKPGAPLRVPARDVTVHLARDRATP